ncbi:hypothetical protein GIB67_031556 [Kingdonia uniflora]|uniref:AB hydrolase-1 domain-containing protein n=1 Tax=Kingdonia uniflora TaxID=39325 RepID=A0A7J7PBB3_9MAGN|nr:hypothetical protein GIB67_031556 [Kingdonia uniflora]
MEGTIEYKMVSVNGINMHIAENGNGPVVLLLHRFPELWYIWRHQIHILTAHGYRPVAPDLRGYGDMDAPPSINSYTSLHTVGDLIVVIDHLEQEQPGEIEADIARAGIETVLKRFLTFHNPRPLMIPRDKGLAPDGQIRLLSWLSEKDLYYYISNRGFTGGINYFRAFDLYVCP